MFLAVGLYAAEVPPLTDIVQALEVDWPKNKTIHFVCHGHSVPAGYFKTPVVNSDQSYPALWQTGLRQQFPHAVLNVIVTAIGGEDSIAGAARFERDVLALRPAVVTIDYALNDRGAGLVKAKAAWVQMIEAAKAAGIRVILLTPTPDQRVNIDDPKNSLNLHAEQVRALAKEHEVLLIDSLALFKARLKAGVPLPDLMSQVNHPNGAGHALIAEALLGLFRK
ncbi:MAG: SGNH/GDSL hydrolase family protein [Opitutaceae bacterium]|nr:SGNH/GDSL hydrolase family protein [Opitutaceae bacterium]